MRGWGPGPDDGSRESPREGTKCPLKVSPWGRGHGDPALLTSSWGGGGCPSTDPPKPWAVALETWGGGSAGPEGPNLLPRPLWPAPGEGAKIHQLRHQLAGGSQDKRQLPRESLLRSQARGEGGELGGREGDAGSGQSL